jgi:dihydrofolate reductase
VTDFKEALEKLSQDEGIAEIFVVGGASLYDLSMD